MIVYGEKLVTQKSVFSQKSVDKFAEMVYIIIAKGKIRQANRPERTTKMKVFGDPRARAKARRYIVWCAEDVLFCTGLFGGIALAGWVFHVVFAALGVA